LTIVSCLATVNAWSARLPLPREAQSVTVIRPFKESGGLSVRVLNQGEQSDFESAGRRTPLEP
jgi:hypothetical protein